LIVYKIVNTINNKVYIGKTVKSLRERWNRHKCCAEKRINRYLYDAMNCYGINNFKIIIIDFAESLDKLNGLEKYWIKMYNSTNNEFGYNMTEGGNGGNVVNKERLQQTAKKIAYNRMENGYTHSKETRKKISESHKGILHTEESKRKMSESRKGKKAHPNSYSAETIRKRVESRFKNGNYKQSGKSKRKISEAHIGKCFLSQEELEKRKRRWEGKKNPNYIRVDKEILLKLVNLKYKISDIAKYFNCSRSTIMTKFKSYFNKSVEEYRGRLKKEEIKTYEEKNNI